MARSEPSLAPEWLRTAGSASGGGSSNHHAVSSSSHSDSASLPHSSRNRNSRSKGDIDTIRSPFLGRSSSTNSRRGSSIGSAKHAYSSFNFSRSHRDKDRSREKDRLSYMDPWDNDTLPLGSVLTGRESRDQDQLRRSHSMITRKQGDYLSRGFAVGLKNGGNTNLYNGNGILSGPTIGNNLQKTGFDKDFPSLGAEDRHGGQDVVRVSSPGLSSVVHSLPVSSSALIGGEGWTSALAEVPNVIDKSGTGSLPSPQASAVTTGTLTGTTSLNMAEALVQAPARTRTPPQGSVKTQRLEEWAIKQSRQLIPVVPSAPKGSILNPSDKSKTKQVVRAGEIGPAASRNVQQQPAASQLNTFLSNPNAQIKPDTSKKLLVLKPARENGAPAVKESASPSSSTNTRAAPTQLTVSPSTQPAPVRSANSPKEIKGASMNMISGQTVEKRPYLAQTQSRNEFYNALKQKISTNMSTDPANSSSCISSSSTEEKADNSSKEHIAGDPSSPLAANGEKDNITERVQSLSPVGESDMRFEAADTPDEEEAEFLRSLGWDENNCEDEALTPEEISAFIEQYQKLKPSLLQNLSIIHEEEMQDTTSSSDS
ncbi:PREDICTED: uncharacterized protein LOC104817001 [Tarenaya hassleriana]|uniref:uncharacterized protein LOC104817001 n=1 Tax=Tarenaya hassleriana TaxID=28532 RepID=UPI00053C75D8|nr:PREDICTED: uncharacterized protein LOC104817001 [Tarenaya hassleriana]